MNGNDFILRHSSLQNTTPVRPVSGVPGTITHPNIFPSPSSAHPASINNHNSTNIYGTQINNSTNNTSTNPNHPSNNPNSNQNRKRLQAERAAIRQRIRNDLHKQQTEIRKQRENSEKIKIWREQILPRWNELQHTNKVKELCAKGIPSNIRGKVWPLLIENQLNIDEIMFDSLMREVHMLFHDKMTAKRHANHKHSNHQPHASYEMYHHSSFTDGDSIGDQESSVAASPNSNQPSGMTGGGRQLTTSDHTAAIRIPKRSNAVDLSDDNDTAVIDVTEENWFENERQGSLDQEDFDTIQRQLFGQKNSYLYERMMNSPRKEPAQGSGDNKQSTSSKAEEKTGVIPQIPFPHRTNDVSPSSSVVKKLDSSSIDTSFENNSSHVFKALKRGFSLDMPFELEMEDGDESRKSLNKPTEQKREVDDNLPIQVERKSTSEQLIAGPSSLKPFLISENGPRDSNISKVSEELSVSYHSASIISRNTRNNDDSTIENDAALTDNSNQMSDKIPLSECNEEDEDEDIRDTVYAKQILLQANDGSEGDERNEQDGVDDEEDDEDEFTLRLRGAIPIPEVNLEAPKEVSKKTVAEAAEFLSLQQSPNLVHTPPRREKHSADYLIQAGLLSEGTGTTPLKPISLLQSSPPLSTPPTATVFFEHQQSSLLPLSSVNLVSNTNRSVSSNGERSRTSSNQRDQRIPSSHVPTFSSDLTFQLAELQQLQDELTTNRDGEEMKEEQATLEENIDPRLEKAYTAVSLIEWDLPRTFPTLAFFHDGGAMHTGLERVLLCFALYRPDVGYVQGMSFLVATLLLYMDEYEAFKCLANLMSRRLFCHFYGLKKKAIDAYVKCFDHYFKKLLPLLYKHLRTEDVTSEMFLMDWYLSVFTKALPLEVAAQVWDMYLCEGEVYMLCVALGILKMYAPTLSLYGVEKISPFLLHLPEGIKTEELFNYISQIHIPVKQYEKVRKKMMDECEVDPEDDVIHFDSSLYQQYRQTSTASTATITTTTSSNHRSSTAEEFTSRSSSSNPLQSTWKKMRQSLGGTKNKITSTKIPAPVTTQQYVYHYAPIVSASSAMTDEMLLSRSSSIDVSRGNHRNHRSSSSANTETAVVGLTKNTVGSRSSNNISELPSSQTDGNLDGGQARKSSGEDDNSKSGRQRGSSVSSKQEASLLLSLQNSPSQKQKHEAQYATKQQPQQQQRKATHTITSTSVASSSTTTASHSSSNSTTASNDRSKPQAQSNQQKQQQQQQSNQRRKSKQASSEGCLPS